MTFRRYESYRDSGVEWLGQVPSHWKVKRLRYVAELNPSKAEVANLSDDLELSFLPMEAIGDRGELDLSRTRPIGEVRNGYSYFADEDVVFAKVTPCLENGKGALMRGLIGGRGFGTTELTVLRPKQVADGEYLWWLTCSRVFRGPAEGEMTGAGGLKRVPDEFVANYPTPWPPLAERKEMAAFLDRETAKIDALVEEQRRLIELLKEKRQAVISHAVTKGLNPAAPMKNSGVEWLGKVPAHWSLARLKHLGDFEAGAGFPHDDQGIEGEELSFHKVNALGGADDKGYLRPSQNTISRQTAIKLRAHVFPAGSIVFAKIGAALLLGRIRQLREPACIDNNMMGFTTRRPNDPAFVRYLFALVQFDLIANPGTVPSLNEGQIANVAVAVPPNDEQRSIAVWLDRETKRIDELGKVAQGTIELLAERRAALISAAVTGKIDVRDEEAKARAA